MFRSQIDHHQGDTVFVLTSVTKFNSLMQQHACCNVCVGSCLVLLTGQESISVVMCALGPVFAMPSRVYLYIAI